MTAYAYLRVSTEEQASSGLGLEAQREAIAIAVDRLGIGPVAEWFEDAGVSGKTPIHEREGLLAAVESLKKGDTLIASHRDRFARRPLVMLLLEEEVRKKKAALISAAGEGTASDDPDDVFVRRIFDAVAEHQRAKTALRTSLALRAKRRRGELNGRRAPFGYSVGEGGKLVVNEHEQEAVRLILSWRESGKSLPRISRDLFSTGYAARSGKPLSAMTIKRVCEYHEHPQHST